MNAIHHSKGYSAANALTTGTATLVFGPFAVDHLNNFALFINNGSTCTINFRIRTSYDASRNLEDDFPLGSFTNTQAVGANASSTIVRTCYGDGNPFKYITIFGSATATVGASLTSLFLTGRSNK